MKFTFLATSAGVATKKRNVTGVALGLEQDEGCRFGMRADCGEIALARELNK